MINILRRLVLIAKSWLHALTASAEDPRQDFAVAYRRQRELLQKVRHAQGKIGLSQATLQERITDSRQNLAELQGRARQALEDGREDLARFALQLKLGTERDVTSLEDDLAQLDHEEQVLVMIERRLTPARSTPSSRGRRSWKRSSRPPKRMSTSRRRWVVFRRSWSSSATLWRRRKGGPSTCSRERWQLTAWSSSASWKSQPRRRTHRRSWRARPPSRSRNSSRS